MLSHITATQLCSSSVTRPCVPICVLWLQGRWFFNFIFYYTKWNREQANFGKKDGSAMTKLVKAKRVPEVPKTTTSHTRKAAWDGELLCVVKVGTDRGRKWEKEGFHNHLCAASTLLFGRWRHNIRRQRNLVGKTQST